MIVVITTCGSEGEADRIAEALVAERLAACVQILPMRSVYRWQGAIERAEEWQLQVKTRSTLADEVEARIKALHGYDLPEIVALPVAAGSSDYISWVRAETRGPL
jgi:periplasmic divalent cation tolerance protein